MSRCWSSERRTKGIVMAASTEVGSMLLTFSQPPRRNFQSGTTTSHRHTEAENFWATFGIGSGHCSPGWKTSDGGQTHRRRRRSERGKLPRVTSLANWHPWDLNSIHPQPVCTGGHGLYNKSTTKAKGTDGSWTAERSNASLWQTWRQRFVYT